MVYKNRLKKYCKIYCCHCIQCGQNVVIAKISFLAKIIFNILNRFEIIRVCYRIYFCKEVRFRKVWQKRPRKF